MDKRAFPPQSLVPPQSVLVGDGHDHKPPASIEGRDQRFLQELNDWMRLELSQVDDRRDAPWQRYTIYRQAFSNVRQQLTATASNY